jgi:hypothetical protein
MITIPKLKELYDGILADLESSVSITIPFFGKNFLRGLAAVQAAKLKLIYLALAMLQKNIFVDQADPESKGGTLERFGRVKIGRNPFAAIPGQYVVLVTGEAGAVIAESQTFKSNDDSLNPGVLFVLDEEYTLSGSGDSITLRALSAGVESKLLVGDELTTTSPIALVEAVVVVNSVAVEPEAAEDIEDYRNKVLNSYRLEPQGGAPADYRLWSQDAQGVKETYPYARSGYVNEVNVFVEATVADSVDGKGTPSAGLLSDVYDVINKSPDATLPNLDRGRRPVSVVVNTLAVTPKDIDIEIVGYIGLDATIEALILSEITKLVDSIRPFVDAIDIFPKEKNDILDTNKLISAILTARPGSVFTSVVLKVDGVTYSTYTFEGGEITYFNSITYL